MPVNRPPDSYQNFESKWKRCRDCREGSDAVKAAGFDYLPPLSSHETGSRGRSEYDAYRMRALFYNAMARTVQGVAGVIFQKAPTFILTPQIEGHEQDVTLAEESGEMFALKVTEEILTTGRYGVLVEMSAPGQAIEPRPYWTGYSAENIISVSTSRRNGEQVLTRVVLKESFVENGPDDEFEENVVDQYRVLSLGDEDDDGRFYRQTIWREEQESKTWIPSEQFVPMRRNKPLDFIPFVIIGPASVAPTPIPKPPLLDLVEVLLSHYRNSADLQHGLHKVALPQPWVAGIQGSATDDNSIPLGASVVWMLDANGRAGMLEFTGAGLGAIRTNQLDLQSLMATLGARLLEEPATAETATAVRMRHSGEQASIRTIAAAIETGLTSCFQWHGWWVGTAENPHDVEAGVELNRDFFSMKASSDEIKTAMLLWQSGSITWETFYYNLTEGEWARPGIDAEAEHIELINEGSATPAPLVVTAEEAEAETEELAE